MKLSAWSPVFFWLLTDDDGDGFRWNAYLLQDSRDAFDDFLFVFQAYARPNIHLHKRQQHRLDEKATFIVINVSEEKS